MRFTMRAAAGLVLGIGVLLAGCNGGDDIDYERACRLLDADEVEEILGVDVYGGQSDTDRTIPASFCEWIIEGGDTTEGGEPALSLFVSEGSDEDSLEEFDRRRDADDAEEVEDLGDAAYFSFPNGTDDIPFLHVRVDDHVATIGVSDDADHPVNGREARKFERAAADLIVDRL
jgi:hypothetical protein